MRFIVQVIEVSKRIMHLKALIFVCNSYNLKKNILRLQYK